MTHIHGFEVDPDLARIYLGGTEATFVGPGDLWEVEGDVFDRVAAARVPDHFGVPRSHTIQAMRAAVAETGDPVAAMGGL